jgi:predicted Ser/Thr protein kinase/tetratricopeptide (TPR) repeat protein
LPQGAGAPFPTLAPVPEVAEARLDPRRRFGQFVILGELGKGGMGVVYKAWDERLRRTVALKLLLAGDADPEAKARFQREAQAVARLRHPAIVAIHDVGEVQGKSYIAMDYIDGQPLDRRLAGENALSFEDAIASVSKAARALQYAHEQGVVHRDMKPANIMIDANDEPFVLDFGLAKIQGSRSLATREGSVIGTPNYMPPEQVGPSATDAGAVGPRSDVYGLGATLYHVITGKPPFEGPSEINVVTQLLMREAPAPSELNRRAVGDLDTIVAKCLEKDAARRYATAAELADEIDRYLAGEPLLARPLGFFARTLRSLGRNKKSLGAALAATLVTVAALAYPILRPALEARRLGLAAARARDAVAAEGASRRKKAVAALEKAWRDLDAGGAASQIAADQDAVAHELQDVAAIGSSLAAIGRSAGGPDTPDAELASAVAAAGAELAPGKLLAWAAHARGRGFKALGRPTDATRERALAYRFDPSGEHGAAAFLEIAEDLAEKEDWTRALGLFRTIAARTLPAPLRARADVDAGRALLALGSIDEARSVLRRAIGRKALDEAATRDARWLETVAAHFAGRTTLATGASGVIVHRFAPGSGPEDVILLTGGKIVAYRLDASAKLAPVASVEAGPGATTLTLVKTPEGERLAVAAGATHDCAIELYRFQDDRLELTHRARIPGPFLEPAILAAGDADGTGEDVLACRVRVESRRSVPLLLRHVAGALERVELAPDINYEYQAAFADLDGCGKAELVLGAAEWSGFSVTVFKDGRPVFTRVLGTPRGMTVGRSGGRDQVLVATDRSHGGDAIFADDPAFHPEVPDAVWKLTWPAGEPVLEKVLERPFEERDRWAFSLPARTLGALREQPLAAFVREEGGSQHRLVVLPPPGLSPVRIGFPAFGGLDQGDLRGDGGTELVFASGGELVVAGLGDAASAVAAPDTNDAATQASPLDVGLDLLDCGEAREAAVELQGYLARPGEATADRSRASLALARALDLAGEHASARDTCLALANADPRCRKDAILLAALQAEAQGDWSAAVEDLGRIRALEALSEDERVEIERRLRRLEPLAALRTWVTIDRASLAQSPLLEVAHPILVARSERGFRIRARRSYPGDEEVGAASLALPILYDGSSFALKARLFVERLEFGDTFSIFLENPETRAPAGAPRGAGFEITCGGGGNLDTYLRRVVTGGATVLSVGDFDRREPVDVEIVYVEADAVFRCTVEHAGVRRTRVTPLSHPLSRGLAHLRIAARTQHQQGSFSVFDVASVELQGRPGTFAAAGDADVPPGEKRDLARASAAFSVGDEASAADALAALAARATDPEVARTASLLAGLASSDLGRAAEADARLAAASARAGDRVVWEREVFGLTEGQRAALARVYGRGQGSHALVSQAIGLLRGNRAGEAVIAFLAAGDEARAHSFELAQALERCGDAERALAVLEPVKDPRVDGFRGLCALELGRYEDACRSWENAPPPDDASLKRARRLAASHGLEVR